MLVGGLWGWGVGDQKILEAQNLGGTSALTAPLPRHINSPNKQTPCALRVFSHKEFFLTH